MPPEIEAIQGLVVAADIDDEGNPVDPSFTVPSDQKQIMVIARIGEVGSQLELAWYRLPDAWGTDDGAEEELFRHQVEVTSGDVAWSIGTNPGTLAAGGYIVRATLGDESAEVEFAVVGPAAPAEGPVDAGSVPVSGESGSSQASSDADGARTCDELWATLRSLRTATSVDPTAQTVPDDPIPIDLAQRLVIECGGFAGYFAGSFELDPCYSADPSDLPGTTVVITWETGFSTVHRTMDETVVLGDDTLAPGARVRSNPGPGKQVKEGDQIQVTAVAEERRSGGPWQMGVERIQLLSLRPTQEVVDSVDFTAKRGKACDEKQWEGTLEATYTVPPNPPPVIELCVVAEDWAGNGADRGGWKCAEFPTEEVWTGTLTIDSVSRSLGSNGWQECRGTASGKLRVVVDPTGRIGNPQQPLAGPFQTLGTDDHTCVDPDGYTVAVPIGSDFSVTGQADERQLNLSFHFLGAWANFYGDVQPIAVPKSGDSASVQGVVVTKVPSVLAGEAEVRAVYTINLCRNCEPSG